MENMKKCKIGVSEMKYKALSLLVVVATTISVVTMLLSTSKQNYINGEESIKVIESQKENKQISKASEIKGADDEGSGDKIQEENSGEHSNTDTKNSGTRESELSNSIPKEQSFIVIDNRGIKGTNKNKDLQLEDYPDSAAVFKVESSTIEDNLSLVEKAKLLTVVAKISPLDYATISNYLYDENSARGIINTFSLLKKRLSERDYEKVRDLASKYMDVNCIENYIN